MNKRKIKENIKEKIKQKLKKELLEEIYNELLLEENDITNEISSMLDDEIEISKIEEEIKGPPVKKAKKKKNIIITVEPILKIASHALKYASNNIPTSKWVEVIGLLAGDYNSKENILYIKDAYPMGHGTALNAEIKDYNNFERAFQEIRKKKLFICGWYHSHPSYGTFMSMEDLETQSRYQKLWSEAVALVIDPYQIDGTSYGFEIFRANLKSKKWFKVPFSIQGDITPELLPELVNFINPIVEGKAIYLEYDEE
ncbi:MAG: hypothetical protein GF383_06310 [Candidatus Lokiarchaeota archaeon]|nr:hypothetical protein [Candidatus Lokiarchaeota archaeon]